VKEGVLRLEDTNLRHKRMKNPSEHQPRDVLFSKRVTGGRKELERPPKVKGVPTAKMALSKGLKGRYGNLGPRGGLERARGPKSTNGREITRRTN